MQSGSYWAFREGAELPDPDDGAPDWRTLSEKVSTRRKGPILCTFCHEPINIGDRYRTVSAMEDGRFVLLHLHTPTCPKFAAQDRAEAEAQFKADAERFFPAENGPSDLAAQPTTSAPAPDAPNPAPSAAGEL